MTHNSKSHLYKALFFGSFFTYLGIVFFNLKDFQIWEQITDLHEAGLVPSLSTLYSHPHGMRFILISPIYSIADLLHTSPNKIFSFLAVLMCMAIPFSIVNTIALFQKVKNHWELKFFIFLFFAILSLSMNGRLMFGLCAYSMMIYGTLLFTKGIESGEKKYAVPLFLITLSLLFSSVSSGVAISFFTICFPSIFGILIYFYWNGNRINLFVVAYLFAIALLDAPIILALIQKNVTFFGEGINAVIPMTQHGILSKPDNLELQLPSTTDSLLKVIWIGFTLLLVSFIYIYRTNFLNNPMRITTSYCMGLLILLSVFAHSILTMAFIPATIMLVLLSGKISSMIGGHLFEDYHSSLRQKT